MTAASIGRFWRWLAVLALAGGCAAGTARASSGAGTGDAGVEQAAEKVMRLPIRTDGPKSLDPVEGSTVYDNMACAQIYETLLTNKYADPMAYEPLLLADLPTSDDNGKTWKFVLKEGVRFQDNACFEGGKGRLVKPEDVFYSLKRLADGRYNYENYWLIEGAILGLDELKDKYQGRDLNYDEPVAGFRKINEREFEIELTKPVTRFLWVLTMFQTSVVPREAVEMYGDEFAFNPVGTGPFILRSKLDWVPKQKLVVYKNPSYHEVYYPDRREWNRDDRKRGLHRPAGKRVPFVDSIEFTMFPEDQPMWLRFYNAGTLGYTQVPDPYYEKAFDKQTRELRPEAVEKGITAHTTMLLDFIFRGFNMEDPVVGGYTPEKKALRQAISLAVDLDEFNERFYSGLNVVYDGPIPPGLDGYPEGGRAEAGYRGPDLERARAKLTEAGFDGGIDPSTGGPLRITYYTSRNVLNQQMAELFKRQLARINVELDVKLVDFSTLIETVNKKNAQMFSFAWSSDYPDAENNLALFYGPNEAPGANHYNYKNAEYDALYERVLTMLPGDERTKVYERMRDMILEDVPYIGSMARQRNYLIAPWLLNCRPTERYYGWFKYLDVDTAKLPD